MMIVKVSLEKSKLLVRSIQPAVEPFALRFVHQQYGRCAYLPPPKTHFRGRKAETEEDFHVAFTSKGTVSLEGR